MISPKNNSYKIINSGVLDNYSEFGHDRKYSYYDNVVINLPDKISLENKSNYCIEKYDYDCEIKIYFDSWKQ